MRAVSVTTRTRFVGLMLLASLLLYASGAALSLHHHVDHGEAHAVAGHDHDCHGHPAENTEPAAPADDDCGVCDMLAGLSKSVVVPAVSTPSYTLTAAGVLPVTDVPYITRFAAPDNSQRGPPVLA